MSVPDASVPDKIWHLIFQCWKPFQRVKNDQGHHIIYSQDSHDLFSARFLPISPEKQLLLDLRQLRTKNISDFVTQTMLKILMWQAFFGVPMFYQSPMLRQNVSQCLGNQKNQIKTIPNSFYVLFSEVALFKLRCSKIFFCKSPKTYWILKLDY